MKHETNDAFLGVNKIKLKNKSNFLVRYFAPLFYLVCFQVSADVSCSNENSSVSATTPTSNFTISNGNGVIVGSFVIDRKTNLMWMRCSLGQEWDGITCTGTSVRYEWKHALEQAKNAPYFGFEDWRLPNKNELASIIEDRCWSPSINEHIFPKTSYTAPYWTSTPSVTGGNSRWFISFRNGQIINGGLLGNQANVRLVRDNE